MSLNLGDATTPWLGATLKIFGANEYEIGPRHSLAYMKSADHCADGCWIRIAAVQWPVARSLDDFATSHWYSSWSSTTWPAPPKAALIAGLR